MPSWSHKAASRERVLPQSSKQKANPITLWMEKKTVAFLSLSIIGNFTNRKSKILDTEILIMIRDFKSRMKKKPACKGNKDHVKEETHTLSSRSTKVHFPIKICQRSQSKACLFLLYFGSVVFADHSPEVLLQCLSTYTTREKTFSELNMLMIPHPIPRTSLKKSHPQIARVKRGTERRAHNM